MMIKFNSLSAKILLAFLVATALPLLVSSYISFSTSQKGLEYEIAQRLISVADHKVNIIEAVADSNKTEIEAISKTSNVQDAMIALSKVYRAEGPQSDQYQQEEKKHRPFLRRFQEGFDYYNLFLISPDLDIVFSVNHESDFGTSLKSGPYRNTSLANVTRASIANFEASLSIIELYQPSQNIAAFAAVPLLKSGKLIGVLAVQFKRKALYDAITDRTGLGLTGETVVGQIIRGGFLVTAPLLHVKNAAFTKTFAKNDTGKFLNASRGETGHGIFKDYRGIPVLGVWRNLPSYQWGMVVKIDVEEAFANIHKLELLNWGILIASISLVIILSLLLTQTILRPIETLNVAAKSLQAGDFQSRVSIHGKDEIAQLGLAFNSMSMEIEDNNRVQARQVDELSKVNIELERFTYTVSHDLKSPLITIGGFIGMIEKDLKKDKFDRVNSDLARIRSAAEKMRQLLDDLLELSRIGRIANPSQNLHQGQIIGDALERVHGRIMSGKVRVDVKIPDDLPVVFGDKPRITEVWQNLVENAVKFSIQQPDPVIEIGARVDEDWLECYVKDNGMGIDDKYLKKIFGLFERLDAGEEGTGIGLALVKQIIEVHGGRIWAESQGLGQGTTLTFRLPLKNTGPDF